MSNAEWRERNREKIRAYGRKASAKARAKNPEKMREANRRSMAKAYAANPTRFRERTREWWLRNSYGMSAEDYKRMHDAQNGLCAICSMPEMARRRGTRFAENGVRYSLAVDHDHETGKVRGLTCRQCNIGLGHFQDDPERLRNAIEYLERFAREV